MVFIVQMTCIKPVNSLLIVDRLDNCTANDRILMGVIIRLTCVDTALLSKRKCCICIRDAESSRLEEYTYEGSWGDSNYHACTGPAVIGIRDFSLSGDRSVHRVSSPGQG